MRALTLRRTLVTLGLMAVLFSAAPAFAGATIIINNTDGPGVGFNDPTPVAPVGGNPGTTLGAQRLNAFQFAADIWGAILQSDVTIVVQATFFPAATVFGPLPCTATGATLGAAGSIQIFANFPNAPLANTWYQAALANKLAGADITPGPLDPGFVQPPFNDDIFALFNDQLDSNPACLGGRRWYYGFDTNHGNSLNLVTVLLHEFGHGLGSANFVNEGNGTSPSGLPDVYSSNTLDVTTGKTWNQMTVTEIRNAAINCDNEVWVGSNVTAVAPRFLAPGSPSATINSPASIARAGRVGPAAFGPVLGAPNVSGDVVLVQDGVAAPGGGTPTDGCEPFTNAAAVAGNIALLDRGLCTFGVKVANAQAAGATAVLVADNVNACPPAGLGGTAPVTITIPSARITLADGNAIKGALGSGPVNVTLGSNPALLAGANAAGQVKVNATNPVAAGSSISHWDPITFPNTLMEPAINADLPLAVDLTGYLFLDEGWTFMNIMIDGCDTGVPNAPIPGGSIATYVVDFCAADPRNHGQFVSCVNHRAKELRNQGWITQQQRNELQHCAAQADIPPGH